MNRGFNIPTYGKLYLASSIILSLMVFAKSVDPYNLAFTFKVTIFEFDLWRPFSAILYLSRVGILLPFHLIFAAIAFNKSNKMFDNAQFTWIFLLSVLFLSLFSTFSSLYFYGNSFVMILLMIWAVQYSSDQFVFKNIRIPSIYFPLIYAATMVILGSSFKHYMAGFIFGLLLGVVKNPNYVQKNGDMFPMPLFIQNFFLVSNQNYQAAPNSPVNNPRNQQISENRAGQGYFSGAGYRIG